jgi:predicted kinase
VKHVTVLAGPPGSGKTHYRKEHLPAVPGVDIKDIYAENRAKFPDFPIDWRTAHHQLQRDVAKLLRKHSEVWVEAMYEAESPSLLMLLDTLRVAGARWTIVRMETPLEDCFARVKSDFEEGKTGVVDTESRMRILADLIAKHEARPGFPETT